LRNYWQALLHGKKLNNPGANNELEAMRRNPTIMKRVQVARRKLQLKDAV
jgi:hypothetical protein